MEIKKSIKIPKTAEKKNLKVALHLLQLNSFLQNFFLTFTYHPIEGTQHQKNKN